MFIKMCIVDENPINNILYATKINGTEIYHLNNKLYIMVLDKGNDKPEKNIRKVKKIYSDSIDYKRKKYIFFDVKFAKFSSVMLTNSFFLNVYNFCINNNIKMNSIQYQSNKQYINKVAEQNYNDTYINVDLKNNKEDITNIFNKFNTIKSIMIIINNQKIKINRFGYIDGYVDFSFFDENKDLIIEILNN